MCIAYIKMALAVIHQTHTHAHNWPLCFVNLCLNYYLITLWSLVAICTLRCEPALQECTLTQACMHKHTHKLTNKHTNISTNHPLLLTPFCSHLYLQHYSLLPFNSPLLQFPFIYFSTAPVWLPLMYPWHPDAHVPSPALDAHVP